MSFLLPFLRSQRKVFYFLGHTSFSTAVQEFDVSAGGGGGHQRCFCISSPQLKVLDKRHVLPSLFPQRRCSQGASGRLSVENAGQVKPSGAGASDSPVCCTPDLKQSGSLLLHPKGEKNLG